MFATLKGYTRLPFTGYGRYEGGNGSGIYVLSCRRSLEDHSVRKIQGRWIQRRILRVALIIFIPLCALFGALYVTHKGEAVQPVQKGEFDDCSSLVPLRNPVDVDNPSLEDESTQAEWARIVLPSELFSMLEKGQKPTGWIIHQSWKNRDLPKHFQKWSEDWRRIHGRNWIYVLWTDEDNRKLVEDYYSQYLDTYVSLPREIFRVDMVRNMYLHRFGGVYADLDLVPLSPLHLHLPKLFDTDSQTVPRAYVGQMGDLEFEHSIPNAFMASSPGHPFWLEPLEYVREHCDDPEYNLNPESLTGPVALRNRTLDWLAKAESGASEAGLKVEIIADGKIYPLSWVGAAPLNWCLCRLHSPWFDQGRCNALYPKAWTIT